MISEKRGRPGRPRKDEPVMKVLAKGAPAPIEEEEERRVEGGLRNLTGGGAYGLPESTLIKKRKRGRPRKNIKFKPLVSNRGIVFEEELEEELGGYLGKRLVQVNQGGGSSKEEEDEGCKNGQSGEEGEEERNE